MRFVTFLKLVVAACVAFVIALVAVVQTIDVRQYRLLVIDLLHAATGRTVAIRGDFRLALSLNPRIVATDVAVANPPGVAPAEFLNVARVEAEIGLLALLRREVEVQRLHLVEPRLTLAIDETGQVNWGGAPPRAVMPGRGGTAAPATTLSIQAASVTGGRLVLRDRSARGVAELVLDQIAITARPNNPIGFSAKGRFGRLPLELAGSLGSLSDLANGVPFSVRVEGSAGAHRMRIEGMVADPLTLGGLDLAVTLQGADLAEAAGLLGRRLPGLGEYRIQLAAAGSWAEPSFPKLEVTIGRKEVLYVAAKGRVLQPWAGRGVLVRGTAESEAPARLAKVLDVDMPLKAKLAIAGRLEDTDDGWQLSDLAGTVGRTDLSGTATLAMLGPRPLLTATLTSRTVEFEDFGFRALSPAAKVVGGPLFGDDSLLPLTDLPWDIDVTWTAEKVTAQGTVLCVNPDQATLQLRGGVLMLSPFTMVQPQ